MFARFDENPEMTLRVIKETKRYGRTHGRTHGRTDARTDNVKTVYPLQTKFAGGITRPWSCSLVLLLAITLTLSLALLPRPKSKTTALFRQPFNLSCLINSIIHEPSCKILYVLHTLTKSGFAINISCIVTTGE